MAKYLYDTETGKSLEVTPQNQDRVNALRESNPARYVDEDDTQEEPSKTDYAQKKESKIVPVISENASVVSRNILPFFRNLVDLASNVPGLIGETISPNITELAQSKGEDFSLASTEYAKAAGRDISRAIPFLTAPFGGELPAAAGSIARASYPVLRGSAEAGLSAVGQNLLGGDYVNPLDAMITGGALSGAASHGIGIAGKGIAKVTPIARDAMAKMANVSPEALDAYSSYAGRQNIAKAFGSEEQIVKDLTDMAGPSFMKYMPETEKFNEAIAGLKTPTSLGQFAKDLLYNPAQSRGGGALYEGQQRAAREISENYRAPMLNREGTAYRIVTPKQLNEQRKQFGQELDNAWNEIGKGIDKSAVDVGKRAYSAMRNRLIDIAEKEGAGEAKALLAEQAKKLGARDDFLNAWVGKQRDRRNIERSMSNKVVGIMQRPTPRMISDFKVLQNLDKAIGTDFSGAVADASYARQLASKGARPGSFSASILPKYETGALKTFSPIIGGSPVTGGRYLENIRAAQSISDAAKGRTFPISALYAPILSDETANEQENKITPFYQSLLRRYGDEK